MIKWGRAQVIAMVIAGVWGCAESREDAADPPDAGSTLDASTTETPDADAAMEEDRCESFSSDPQPCDGGAEYYARATGVAADPYRCELGDFDWCHAGPAVFATLSECAATCETATPEATDCLQAGTGTPSCDASKAADSAELEMHTPYGSLHLTNAFLIRSIGFINDVEVELSTEPERRFGSVPRVRFALWAPVHATESLVGSHDTKLSVTLCDRIFELPVRVTVTVDEVVQEVSERFEARIDSLAPDVEISGQVAFSRVCLFTSSE